MNKNPYASASQENKDEVIKKLAAENAKLRAALENCKPVMEAHAGTTRLALFNEALKETK